MFQLPMEKTDKFFDPPISNYIGEKETKALSDFIVNYTRTNFLPLKLSTKNDL
jgi:hypothetical protein